MRIHQVLVGARDGDAITQIALSLRSVASAFGEAAVFARHVDPSVAGRVLSIDELAARCEPGDVVIHHVSIGDEVVGAQVAATPARLWVLYHNITPSSFFADDPVFAEHLDLGRRQLAELAPRVERVLTVSEFNRRDLLELGFADTTVIPPMLDPDRLARQPSDPHFGRELIRRTPGPMFLFVGQVLPHKRPDLLVAAQHLVLSHHRPDATLVIAGHHPSEPYARKLAAFAASLGLGDRVWITGGVHDSRLAELYRRADVLVTASQHEGLCLPVIEAMAMSVPVVVSGSGALPETVSDCGIVVRDEAPESYAEALMIALRPDHRVPVALRGRERARSMSLESSRTEVARLLGRWLDPPA